MNAPNLIIALGISLAAFLGWQIMRRKIDKSICGAHPNENDSSRKKWSACQKNVRQMFMVYFLALLLVFLFYLIKFI